MKHKMSFLKEISQFSKASLKPTTTEVTFVDGRRVREVKDERSGLVKAEVLDKGLGFVGDYKPDLQVAPIMPDLYLGSQDVAADFDLLKLHGVTHILNVAAMLPNTFPNYFTYCNLDILDLPETDIRTYFTQAFQFIDKGRSEGSVFVHCNAGVSRAASIVIGYMMRTDHILFQQAYDHVKSIRPSIRPNDGFRKQLEKYIPLYKITKVCQK